MQGAVPQRTLAYQECKVCGFKSLSKSEMADHAVERHGQNWPIGWMTKADDQREFRPCLTKTPWGRDLR